MHPAVMSSEVVTMRVPSGLNCALPSGAALNREALTPGTWPRLAGDCIPQRAVLLLTP